MTRLAQAEQLMERFAERTGLAGSGAPVRYLWTDAFAVCNYLGLYLARDDELFLTRARDLVEQVHDVLGAYAPEDSRSGWLGGMDEEQHRRSPTGAGLRIGKPEPERERGAQFDERREWNRDGQYFHYLTRWMHALERAAEVTGESQYHRWAVDLALAAFDGFVELAPGEGMVRMHWKMSVDLDRPLVPSMGQHDPLDGWVTAHVLASSEHADDEQRRQLEAPIGDYRRMFSGRDLITADALGLGGLLFDAWQLFRIMPHSTGISPQEVATLVDAAVPGLEYIARHRQLEAAPAYRLAFRELGLATGLHALRRMIDSGEGMHVDDRLKAALDSGAEHAGLAEQVEELWLLPENRSLSSWNDHRDINDVMLATCLAPDGYLGAASCEQARENPSS